MLELASRFASDADFLSYINSHQVIANLEDARIGAFRPRQQFVVGIGWTNDMGVHGQFRTRPGENFPSLFRCGVVVNDSLRSFGSGWIESAHQVAHVFRRAHFMNQQIRSVSETDKVLRKFGVP